MFLVFKTDLPLCPELLGRGTERSCYVSENCRIVEVGRDLLRPSNPTIMLKQGQLEQGYVQLGFEYLYRWKVHKSTDSFCQKFRSQCLRNPSKALLEKCINFWFPGS